MAVGPHIAGTHVCPGGTCRMREEGVENSNGVDRRDSAVVRARKTRGNAEEIIFAAGSAARDSWRQD